MKKLISIILLITAIMSTSCKEDVAVHTQKNTEKKVQQLSYSFNTGKDYESTVKSGNVPDDSTFTRSKVLSTEIWEESGALFAANLIEDNDIIITKATQEVSSSGVYTFYAYKDVEIKKQSVTPSNKIFEVPVDEGTKYGIIFFSTVEDGGVPSSESLKLDHANKEMIYEAKFNENLGYKVFDKNTMPGSNLVDVVFSPVFSQLSISVPRDLVGSLVTVNEVKLLGGAQDKATVKIKYNSEATSNIKVTYTQTKMDYETKLDPVVSGNFTILKGNYHNFIPNGNESRIYLKMTTDAGATVEKEFKMKDKRGNSVIFEQGRRYKLSIENQALVSLAIEPSETTLIKGNETKLKLVATYSSGGAKVDVTERAEWVSSKPTTATVSMVAGTKGLVKAVEAGETTITAKFAGKETTAIVRVTNDVREIVVVPNLAEVVKGRTISLTAIATYQDGTKKDVTKDENVIWESVAPGTASVGAKTGIVKGESVGSAKVRATYGGQTGEATVNVTPAVVEKLIISPNPLNIVVANSRTGTLTATIIMSDGSTITPTTGSEWSFSPTGIVTGSPTGPTINLTAIKGGTTTATVICLGMSATATVNVNSTAPPLIYNGKTYNYYQWDAYAPYDLLEYEGTPPFGPGSPTYNPTKTENVINSAGVATYDEIQVYLGNDVYWDNGYGGQSYTINGVTYHTGLWVKKYALCDKTLKVHYTTAVSKILCKR